MITTQYKRGTYTANLRNLGVHVMNISPGQAQRALNTVWWYGLIVTMIALTGAVYFN